MEVDEIRRVRLGKLKNLEESGIAPYGARFERTSTIAEILKDFQDGKEVIIAGRFMSHRSHGKVMFADLEDQSGKIQLFIKVQDVAINGFPVVKALDIGDIIGVKGTLFVTKTGQQSVRVAEITFLSKSIMSLPEKWHGLKDVEIRYRQRYVDLIANKEVREIFITRSKIIGFIRSYLDRLGFLEVETPMLQPMAGGARGRPFKSKHNAYDMDVFLRIAPELYLKRLLVGGLEKVYEMNRNFRNEGVSTRHNPEFTMLEVYQAYGDYEDMMKLTEGLVSSLAREITGSYKVTYQGREIDFTPPWERRSFARIVKEKFDINPQDDAGTMLEKVKAHKAHGVKVEQLTRSVVMKIVEEMLEEEDSIDPVFFTEYFTFLCPLAKTDPGNPAISQRFEVFIGGLEVGNAYSELNDAQEQRRRLLEDLEDDVETGNRAVDEDFLTALEYGMPPAGGLGIGIDRLVMLLTDAPSIKDVILFPLMKPLEKQGAEPGI
ncbi:MAG: lysine--tRNA ligase [Omnitrophica WOR_2 bacterium RIFCSPHIGHO2_02_FULL_52_10]|nr:MAG: lysine--tRNA ligase [Omnitrophica WOR_2 bacterium RIFCSPHIGHO2_02_FULL_52_10]